jgi:cytochrome c biogenesis protein CcdA
VTAAALLAAGWTPATVGLLTGALTWAAVTSRPDLPRRGGRLPAG